jgi:predicted RNA binding protein YcfA (HicA-like mRNA interferase family)
LTSSDKIKKFLEELKKNPKNVRFKRICTIAEVFGFTQRRGKGSHKIFIRNDLRILMNFQNVKGKVKPYQVKQFIKVVEQYGLIEEGSEDAI